MSGHSRVFSGEHVQLRCSIPDGRKSSWNYLWFKGTGRLEHHAEMLTLKGFLSDSGEFQCQGVRDTAVGNIYTQKSPPVEINMDGKNTLQALETFGCSKLTLVRQMKQVSLKSAPKLPRMKYLYYFYNLLFFVMSVGSIFLFASQEVGPSCRSRSCQASSERR